MYMAMAEMIFYVIFNIFTGITYILFINFIYKNVRCTLKFHYNIDTADFRIRKMKDVFVFYFHIYQNILYLYVYIPENKFYGKCMMLLERFDI